MNTSLNSKFFSLFMLSFGFFAIESFGQSEQEPIKVEIPNETPLVDDLDLSHGNRATEPQKESKIQPASNTIASQPRIKKIAPDPIVENQDVKKGESTSTLSFNLFLYIVDKFRAD